MVITDSKNIPIGSGVAGPDGSFTITIKPPQTNGETLTAISTDPAGNSSPPETAVAPDITAPQPPTNLVINGAGNEVTGKAEPDSTVNILIHAAISLAQRQPLQMGTSPQRWYRRRRMVRS